MRRLAFLVGLAAGYVLGTRAGRERYEQIAKTARGVAQNPAVRQAAKTARETGTSVASRTGGKVAHAVGDRLPAGLAERLPGKAGRRSDDEWGTSDWPEGR